MLDRPRPAGAAVADEASGLVVPLAEQKINRVFERAGQSMIILRRDEDIASKRTDLGGPRFGVRLTVLPHDGRHRLVEERQVEVFDVHEFELGVGALFRDFVDPFGDGLAVAPRPRASHDDGNSKHSFLLFGFDVSVCAYALTFEPPVIPARSCISQANATPLPPPCCARISARPAAVDSRAQSRCSSPWTASHVIGTAPAWTMRRTAIS